MDLGLKGRVALVTGSSRGLGRSTVVSFAREGAHVVIMYHQGGEAAEELATQIRAEGGSAIVVGFDLGSESSIHMAVDSVLSVWGRIDILVNNALASAPRQQLYSSEESRIHDWQFLLRVNIEGPYLMIQAVLPAMREKAWGRIVNVSSTIALDGVVGSAWYATAKSALHGLTRTLSRELGPSGILVNVVMPGLTSTDRQPITISKQFRERAAASLPIRRLPTADEVAQVTVFLCSQANTIVTGEIIRVSGG